MLTMWRVSIVLLVFLFPGPAFSNPPSPTPPKAEQKNQTYTKNEEQPTSTHQRGTESSPLFIKVIPSLTVEPSPAKEAEDGREYTSAEWWLVYITGALVLATCGLIIYTARLWGATKSLAEDAKQTADRQAADTKASLTIAKQSADAATQGVALAREEFIATYCPRLIIRRIKVCQASDIPLEINYEIANIGGTRAKIIEISTRLWLPDLNPNSPVPPYAPGDRHMDIIVESGSPYQGRHRVDLTEEIEQFNFRLGFAEGSVLRDSRDPTEVYFFGYIVYLDQLNRRFETAFLRHYDFSTKRFTPVSDPDYEYLA